jgi:hypothetical protein
LRQQSFISVLDVLIDEPTSTSFAAFGLSGQDASEGAVEKVFAHKGSRGVVSRVHQHVIIILVSFHIKARWYCGIQGGAALLVLLLPIGPVGVHLIGSSHQIEVTDPQAVKVHASPGFVGQCFASLLSGFLPMDSPDILNNAGKRSIVAFVDIGVLHSL